MRFLVRACMTERFPHRNNCQTKGTARNDATSGFSHWVLRRASLANGSGAIQKFLRINMNGFAAYCRRIGEDDDLNFNCLAV